MRKTSRGERKLLPRKSKKENFFLEKKAKFLGKCLLVEVFDILYLGIFFFHVFLTKKEK